MVPNRAMHHIFCERKKILRSNKEHFSSFLNGLQLPKSFSGLTVGFYKYLAIGLLCNTGGSEWWGCLARGKTKKEGMSR